MAQSNQSVLYDINLKYTCIMVESHRAQQYMMVSFNFDLSKIGFLHYIRNVVRHKILGLGKTRSGYMYIERLLKNRFEKPDHLSIVSISKISPYRVRGCINF